jgi:hypothetical protein
MEKSNHSEDYSKPFKKIKKNLPIFYIDPTKATQLKALKSFYLFLEYDPFGIYPRFLAKGKEISVDISDAFSLVKTDKSIPIGFKRADDLLDIKGQRFSKSSHVQRTLEYVRSDCSWIKWTLYKLSLLFSKK